MLENTSGSSSMLTSSSSSVELVAELLGARELVIVAIELHTMMVDSSEEREGKRPGL